MNPQVLPSGGSTAASSPATRTTVATFGVLAAFTGVEHGLGAIAQGPVTPPSMVFESWPQVAAFDPLNGEPAMTLVPNMLATGVLAVLVATVLGVWSLYYAGRRHGGTVLLALSVLLLLVGGGFGPPLLGALAGALATRIPAPRCREPRPVTGLVATAWPWPLVVAVACFLGLFPGTTLLSALIGFEGPLLVAALTIGAFLSTALAMWTARAHDLTTAPAPTPVAGRTRPESARSNDHRRLFRLWAATWGTAVMALFGSVTVLTLTLWLRDPAYAETTPDADLGFFVLGGAIGVGLLSQLRREPPLAGLQQALLAAIALTAAGLLGQRSEPLVGGLIILAILAVQAALHPARRSLLRIGQSPSPTLVGLALVAALPALGHGPRLLGVARDSGPSCFLGQCAVGDRPAELAAALLAVPLIGMLAALRTPGWRLPLWTAGAAAFTPGAAALLLPETTTAIGQVTGLAAVVWAVVFVAFGEREHRHGQQPRPTSPRYDGPDTGPSRPAHSGTPTTQEGTPMRILVTYATRHGSTAGIAEKIADTLRAAGLHADAIPVKEIRTLDPYDAVVIGAAAYMFHWLKDATTFAKRHRSELLQRPVWLFSSGPLGSDLVDDDGNDVLQVTRPREFDELTGLLHPRGEQVFFGAWDPQAPPAGFGERMLRHMPASNDAMPAGDFRDWPAIETWAREIAADLHTAPAPS